MTLENFMKQNLIKLTFFPPVFSGGVKWERWTEMG